MDFKNTNCQDFLDMLASKAPVPGGGGACALVGALGIALGHMTGALTEGKKRYIEFAPELKLLQTELQQLQEELIELIDKDAQAFEPLAAAYRLPKDTEKERLHKEAVMEKALYSASLAPLRIMEKCSRAVEILEIMARKGSRLAISDAASGASFCRAALEAAALNVFINTKAMTNRINAQELNKQADIILNEYLPRAEAVYSQIAKQLRS
ncbi:TPA: sugar ABC transporter substrate-binding protein [bacterium UBP9_UBA11836]|nr:sugar ABC transporter substrate-binding protein [bacterium UBP9_UBA11836]